MPGASEPAALRRRAERFASLRAAQRALSRSVHPAELARSNEQGRELLIRLQALSGRLDPQAAETSPEVAEDLERIDALLDGISGRTRELLDQLDIGQLRSTAPLLVAQHPEEVRGLIDVLLDGALEQDDELRKLEYLMTLLCSEERHGRRVVVREPAEVSPRLRETAKLRARVDGAAAAEAERSLVDGITRLLHGTEEIGALRDRIRRLKQELGSGILHPEVFAAAVAYNVAMGNQVAHLIEGSRSIDRLADDLLGASAEPAQPSPAGAPSQTDVLGSAAFAKLVEAFRARIGGREAGDPVARRIAAACPLDGLSPAEIECFDAAEETPAQRLARASVVIGLCVRRRERIEGDLRALGIDPERLAGECVQEVVGEMTAVARKLFADSDYDGAFRISELKTRNLAALAARPERGAHDDALRPEPSGSAPRTPAASPARGAGLGGWSLSGTQVAGLGILVALALLVAFWWPSGWSGAILSSGDLARISPFLESGYRTEEAGHAQFVGRVAPSWQYLGTAERREAAAEIGRRLAESGVERVLLRDAWKRVQVRIEDGELVEVQPRLTSPESP